MADVPEEERPTEAEELAAMSGVLPAWSTRDSLRGLYSLVGALDRRVAALERRLSHAEVSDALRQPWPHP